MGLRDGIACLVNRELSTKSGRGRILLVGDWLDLDELGDIAS
jgi:hypothetical protein